MAEKKKIAIAFGGYSTEHDVSVLTGLQILEAIDSTLYEVFPVYVAQNGCWYVGDALLNRKNYPLSAETKKSLKLVQIHIGANDEENRLSSKPHFVVSGKKGLFAKKPEIIEFDFFLPAFHGTIGEDGAMQGLLEVAGIPYLGFRVLGAACYMNKGFAKTVFRDKGIPHLKAEVVNRPVTDGFIDVKVLLNGRDIQYPVCVKPCNLGSSVGVSFAKNEEELCAGILKVFKLDSAAIVEPKIENLVEYNIAVTSAFGETRTSAIERPMRKDEFLDFKDKYLSNAELTSKLAITTQSEGMAGAIRDLDPEELSAEQKDNLRKWAKLAFEAVGGKGTARIDFMCDSTKGELYLTEVNSFPGSLSCYLWEAAAPKVTFTEILTAMIEEGFNEYQLARKSIDTAEAGSSIFAKK